MDREVHDPQWIAKGDVGVTMADRDGSPEWVPLVEHPEGSRFRLSPQLISLASSLCGYWQIKSFVARVISSFEEPFEHLLDYYVTDEDEDLGIFSVRYDRCEGLAEKFAVGFYPLEPEWYRQLFVAKLISLRVPLDLIRRLKLLDIAKGWEHVRFAEAVQTAAKVYPQIVSEEHVRKLGAVAHVSALQAWADILDIVEPLFEIDPSFEVEVLVAYNRLTDCQT